MLSYPLLLRLAKAQFDLFDVRNLWKQLPGQLDPLCPCTSLGLKNGRAEPPGLTGLGSHKAQKSKACAPFGVCNALRRGRMRVAQLIATTEGLGSYGVVAAHH